MTSVESVDPTMTDRMWSRITRALVDTGRPPHYAELARALGVDPAESRTILHAVLKPIRSAGSIPTRTTSRRFRRSTACPPSTG